MSAVSLRKAEALSNIAFLALDAQGNAESPSLHDVAHAVVKAAPLLNLFGQEAIDTELQAIATLQARHNWQTTRVIALTDHVLALQHRRVSDPQA